MTYKSRTKTRRLAERAPRVIGRHSDNTMIATYAGPVTARSTRFIDVLDTLEDARMEQSRALRVGRESMRCLARLNRGWGTIVAGDVVEYDTTMLSTGRVFDDTVKDARKLLSIADEQEAKGTPLEYAETMRGEIEPALQDAVTKWAEAEQMKAEVVALIVSTNAASEKLHRELIALRRTLATVLGREHPDYRMLRWRRGTGEVIEPEVTPESEPANEPTERTAEEPGVNAA